MSLKRTLLTIFVFFTLTPHSNAQEQKSTNALDKTVVQPLALSTSPPQSPRTTITLKYSPLFFVNARQSRPAVVGTFPNHQQARFLIDTGSYNVFVSENLAHSLGLSPAPSKNPNEAIIDGKRLQQVFISDFDMECSPTSSLLSASEGAQHWKINDAATMVPQQNASFFGADGIIGTGILRNMGAALFDGPNRQITLFLGGNLTMMEREAIGFSAAKAILLTSINTNDSDVYTIPVTLENNSISKNVVLIVDTGSDITMIPRKTALALGLEATAIPSTFMGMAGIEKTKTASVEAIKIGDLVLHNTSVYYPSDDKEAAVTLHAEGAVTDMLGMNILAGYRVLFDFPAHAMYIMPDQPQIKIITK